MNVYFISGLGADRRAFDRIQLPPQFAVHHLDWIEPLRNESLHDYALRLGAGIDASKPFAVVGLSMGGMIASVLAEALPPHKTVLLSSVACAGEFPRLFKWVSFVPVYKLAPLWLLRKPNPVVRWLFGVRSKNEKELMNYLVSHAETKFIQWAMHAIIQWEQKARPAGVYHIHGSADKIFPLKYTQPDAVIENGSHFMVWTRAGEVSRKLAEALSGQAAPSGQTTADEHLSQ